MVDVISPPNGPLIPKDAPAQDINIVEKQLDRFYRARDGMMPWAMVGAECVDFVESRQWTAEDKKLMVEEGRPALTLNKIAPLVRLVKGYYRQNRTEIHFKPGSDGIADDEVAKSLNLASKEIDERNLTDWVNADVFSSGLITGRGFFDTRLSFEKNIFGEIVERDMDPFSVYVDPEATTYTTESWGFVQTGTWMSIEDIRYAYGEQAAGLVDFGGGTHGRFPVRGDGGLTGTENDITPLRSFGLDEDEVRSFDSQYFGAVASYNIFDHMNRERKLIRVIECQHRVWDRGKFAIDMETGDKRLIPARWSNERIAKLEEFCRSKNLPITFAEGMAKRIRWTVTAADRVLYDKWSLYRDFTITPYFPYFRRGITRGMVEDLLDPQKELNKRRSNFLHILNTMAHSGWMFEEGALSPEMEELLESEGGRPGILLKFRKDHKAPERIMPGIPSRGHELAGTQAEEDIKEIAGINDSALGQIDKVQSGRAVEARQKQAVVGAEEYFDNWDRTQDMKGRVRLNIIQDYYTEPRIVRVRGDDGKDQITVLNGVDAAGRIVNNVQTGTFQVVVDKRPMSAAFKEGEFNEAMEMRKEGIPIPDDILIDLSSVPGKEVIKQRLQQAMAAQAAQAGVPAPAGIEGPAPSAPPQPAALPAPEQPQPQPME